MPGVGEDADSVVSSESDESTCYADDGKPDVHLVDSPPSRMLAHDLQTLPLAPSMSEKLDPQLRQPDDIVHSRHVRVGGHFQAQVPPVVPVEPEKLRVSCEQECMWQPPRTPLSDVHLKGFLNTARRGNVAFVAGMRAAAPHDDHGGLLKPCVVVQVDGAHVTVRFMDGSTARCPRGRVVPHQSLRGGDLDEAFRVVRAGVHACARSRRRCWVLLAREV